MLIEGIIRSVKKALGRWLSDHKSTRNTLISETTRISEQLKD